MGAQKVHKQSLENAGVINKKVKEEKIKAHDQNIERHKNFVRRATLIAIHQEHQNQQFQQAFLNGGVDFDENTAALHENEQLDEKSDAASHKASQNTYYSYGVEARSESRND